MRLKAFRGLCVFYFIILNVLFWGFFQIFISSDGVVTNNNVDPTISKRKYDCLEDIETSNTRPHKSQSSRQIFFVETSHPDGGFLELNERKACAIESAARLHPNYNIYVLIVGTTEINPDSFSTKLYENVIKNNPNVHFRSLDVLRFTQDTPLETFFRKGRLKETEYYKVYLADLLRLVALWRYGGLYFDTDVVVLRNFEELGENFLCVASTHLLMTGTMQFSGEGIGHQTVTEFLKGVTHSFNTKDWASNGPVLITRIMRKICKVWNTVKMDEEKCNGVKILQREMFLPIGYNQHMYYFNPANARRAMWLLKDAYTAHIFNHMNSDIKLRTSSEAAYVQLARKHCPNVFHFVGEFF